VIGFPFVLGCFFSPSRFFGFVIGAITIGYYLSTSTTLIAGILEGA